MSSGGRGGILDMLALHRAISGRRAGGRHCGSPSVTGGLYPAQLVVLATVRTCFMDRHKKQGKHLET